MASSEICFQDTGFMKLYAQYLSSATFFSDQGQGIQHHHLPNLHMTINMGRLKALFSRLLRANMVPSLLVRLFQEFDLLRTDNDTTDKIDYSPPEAVEQLEAKQKAMDWRITIGFWVLSGWVITNIALKMVTLFRHEFAYPQSENPPLQNHRSKDDVNANHSVSGVPASIPPYIETLTM